MGQDSHIAALRAKLPIKTHLAPNKHFQTASRALSPRVRPLHVRWAPQRRGRLWAGIPSRAKEEGSVRGPEAPWLQLSLGPLRPTQKLMSITRNYSDFPPSALNRTACASAEIFLSVKTTIPLKNTTTASFSPVAKLDSWDQTNKKNKHISLPSQKVTG